MKISYILPAAIALIILSGCATVTKEMAATGGSKADGTIELSYEHSELGSVTIDEKKAIETAKSRCKSCHGAIKTLRNSAVQKRPASCVADFLVVPDQ